MTLTKERLVEKIKSLLALATGENNSSEEKSLAMQRAQELMAKYSLDVKTECAEPQFVISRNFEPSSVYRIDQALFGILPEVLDVIGKNFGVMTYLNVAPGPVRSVTCCFLGFETNIQLTQYAVDVILYQGWAGYRRIMRLERSTTFAPDYWRGFYDGLVEKFEKSAEVGIGLVVYDPVKAALAKLTGGKTTKSWALGNSLSDAYVQGVEDGKNSTLNKGVGNATAGHGKLLG